MTTLVLAGNLPITNMPKVLAIATLLVATAQPVAAATFTTYNNQSAFESAGLVLKTETFNSITSDASFNNNATVNLPDFSLTGFGNFANNNVIDASPFINGGLAPNGSTFLLGYTNGGSNPIGFTLTFNQPITAFGGTFSDTSTAAITRLRVGTTEVVGDLPTIPFNSTGFYGFTSSDPFTQLTFETINNNNDGFALDDLRYGVPIPFEFSPVVGIAGLGWVVATRPKKKNEA
ncbi:MAG: hypothetical protein SFT94_09490 [Pseudanabaenaceae cyanobacterium bins.68]|nr:hypothetical protein [Pseudanabaenaceae cyanobacterium bins.68]